MDFKEILHKLKLHEAIGPLIKLYNTNRRKYVFIFTCPSEACSAAGGPGSEITLHLTSPNIPRIAGPAVRADSARSARWMIDNNTRKLCMAAALMLSAVVLIRSTTCLQWLVSLLLNASRSKAKQVFNMISIRKFGLVIAAALMIVVAVAPSFAQPASAAAASPYDQQILQARYDYVSARVSFMTSVLSDTASLVTNASDLNTNVQALNSDLSTLKGYVNANDKAGFDNCVKTTIHTDMQSAADALKADRQHFKEWGVTAATKAKLLSDYQSAKATCDSRTNSATVELGGVKLQYYNDVIAKADASISTLGSKGVDVSGMQSAEAAAKSSVIAPLQSAVSSGDASAVKSELAGKCLGNGAPYSDHFFAQSDLAKLNALTAKVSANATAAGHGDQVSDVNAKLSAAQGALSAAGTSPYSGDQKDTVWNNLKAASDELKTIIQELNGGESNQG